MIKGRERHVFISGDELYTGCYQRATTLLRCSKLVHVLSSKEKCLYSEEHTSYFWRQEVQISNARDAVLVEDLGAKTNPRLSLMCMVLWKRQGVCWWLKISLSVWKQGSQTFSISLCWTNVNMYLYLTGYSRLTQLSQREDLVLTLYSFKINYMKEHKSKFCLPVVR